MVAGGDRGAGGGFWAPGIRFGGMKNPWLGRDVDGY